MEWFDAALNGTEFVEVIMQDAVVRPAHQLGADPCAMGQREAHFDD
ncbi:hypothetical protein [Streptomyces sennicomposti]